MNPQLEIYNGAHILDRCTECKCMAIMKLEENIYRVECSDCKYTMTTDRSAGPMTAMVGWNRLQRKLRSRRRG